MTEAKISGQNDDVLFRIFDSRAMQKLATERIIAEKVFKYLTSFDFNCKKSKIDHKF